jgi:hypothetical protein
VRAILGLVITCDDILLTRREPVVELPDQETGHRHRHDDRGDADLETP